MDHRPDRDLIAPCRFGCSEISIRCPDEFHSDAPVLFARCGTALHRDTRSRGKPPRASRHPGGRQPSRCRRSEPASAATSGCRCPMRSRGNQPFDTRPPSLSNNADRGEFQLSQIVSRDHSGSSFGTEIDRNSQVAVHTLLV